MNNQNTIDNLFDKFKNREVKAKEVFEIREISKNEAFEFVRQYHYLGNAKFFAIHSFGLFIKDTNILVGCATFSNPQGIAALQSWFNLQNDCQDVLELSRLCLFPQLNGSNATSFLLSNSIRLLKHYKIRAVITLADSTRHAGSIYQVCNFTYYGTTDKASDFYRIDGAKNPRGKSGSMQGVYLPRNVKHRYAYIIDKNLKCNYPPQVKPKKDETTFNVCCDNTCVVYDDRFNKYYTCPRCTNRMIELTKEENDDVILKSKELTSEELKNYVNSIIFEKCSSIDFKDCYDLFS